MIKDDLRNSFDTVHQWFYENYMVLMENSKEKKLWVL